MCSPYMRILVTREWQRMAFAAVHTIEKMGTCVRHAPFALWSTEMKSQNGKKNAAALAAAALSHCLWLVSFTQKVGEETFFLHMWAFVLIAVHNNATKICGPQWSPCVVTQPIVWSVVLTRDIGQVSPIRESVHHSSCWYYGSCINAALLYLCCITTFHLSFFFL